MSFKKKILKLLEDYSEYKNLKIDWLVEQSDNIEFGHYSIPLFPLTKLLKQDLSSIFEDLQKYFKEHAVQYDFLEKMVFLKGFLNIYIKEDIWQNNFLQLLSENKLVEPADEVYNVMIEYSSPNPGKSFHIGHLRNTLIGLSLYNLYKVQGFSVQGANYLNDTGLHIAKIVWYLQKEKLDFKNFAEAVKNLSKIYAEASTLYKKNDDTQKEVKDIYQKIEKGDMEVWKYVKKLKEWSLWNFQKIYKDLGAHFDQYFYDSEMVELASDYVDELLKKGLAERDDGAIIVNLEKYNLTNALLLKSDGSELYLTKDLALAKKRFDLFDIHKLIYVVGVEQTLHFKQLFKILELDGFKQAKLCQHLSYELVDLPEGKMSSRQGNVVTYWDLRQKVKEAAWSELKERYKNERDDVLEEMAEKITLAALKIWILKYDNNKKILFNIKDAIDFQGDTGPYVLYTVARLNSLFKKFAFSKKHLENEFKVLLDNDSKRLYRSLYMFNNVIGKARQQGRPAVLCNYVLDLAKLVNHYYHSNSVLQAGDEKIQKSRAALLWSSREILLKALEILEIDTLEKM